MLYFNTVYKILSLTDQENLDRVILCGTPPPDFEGLGEQFGVVIDVSVYSGTQYNPMVVECFVGRVSCLGQTRWQFRADPQILDPSIPDNSAFNTGSVVEIFMELDAERNFLSGTLKFIPIFDKLDKRLAMAENLLN